MVAHPMRPARPSAARPVRKYPLRILLPPRGTGPVPRSLKTRRALGIRSFSPQGEEFVRTILAPFGQAQNDSAPRAMHSTKSPGLITPLTKVSRDVRRLFLLSEMELIQCARATPSQ